MLLMLLLLFFSIKDLPDELSQRQPLDRLKKLIIKKIKTAS